MACTLLAGALAFAGAVRAEGDVEVPPVMPGDIPPLVPPPPGDAPAGSTATPPPPHVVPAPPRPEPAPGGLVPLPPAHGGDGIAANAMRSVVELRSAGSLCAASLVAP